jgi:hypothetical protein
MAVLAPNFKISCGTQTMASASDTVVTGLSTVVGVFVSLETTPTVTASWASASIGNQNGTPAAGSFLLKLWQPTSNSNPTIIASTGYANHRVNWIAVGF